MIRVLLVAEHASAESEHLLIGLQAQGYKTVTLFTAGEGTANTLLAFTEKADLVVLDCGCANEALLSCIRRNNQLPVIILSRDMSEQIRIKCFRIGADDYLIKPYNHTELQLRIGAILKRCRGHIFPGEEADRLEVGGLTLDRNAQSVTIHGKQIEVTPLEFKLLWLLLYYRGRVLSKSYTWQSVLGRDYCDFDRSVDMHLSRVRKKLSEAGFEAARLKTVRGRGYSFN